MATNETVYIHTCREKKKGIKTTVYFFMMNSHFGEEFYENDVSVVQRKLAAIMRGKRERERERKKL